MGFIRAKGLRPTKILLTHAHFDHVFGLKECAGMLGVPVYMDPADKETLGNAGHFCRMFGLKTPATDVKTEDIHDGDRIKFGETELEVLSTPGHTPGGVWSSSAVTRFLQEQSAAPTIREATMTGSWKGFSAN